MTRTSIRAKIALCGFTEDEEIDFKGVPMIEIQLSGSTGAFYNEYSYSHPRKDPIAPLLRKMIAAGECVDDDMVVVKRGATTCFKPSTVKTWANYTIMCHDKGGITKTKYVPFDRFGGDE